MLITDIFFIHSTLNGSSHLSKVEAKYWHSLYSENTIVFTALKTKFSEL